MEPSFPLVNLAIRDLRSKGWKAAAIAQALKVSERTVRRRLVEAGEEAHEVQEQSRRCLELLER